MGTLYTTRIRINQFILRFHKLLLLTHSYTFTTRKGGWVY